LSRPRISRGRARSTLSRRINSKALSTEHFERDKKIVRTAHGQIDYDYFIIAGGICARR